MQWHCFIRNDRGDEICPFFLVWKKKQIMNYILMRKLIYLFSAVLLLCGCGSAVTEGDAQPVVSEPVQITDLSDYDSRMKSAEDWTSYTAAVQRRYSMVYEDGTKSLYDLDGVLEEGDKNMHLTQHINADGIQSEIEGWYDGSRLYMTYNTVDYYEDMNPASVRQVMLVPVKPLHVSDSTVESVQVNELDQGTEYVFTLTPVSARSLFDSRYDIYGLNQYSSYEVKGGTITQKFDADGRITSEKAVFESAVETNGILVDVESDSAVSYANINSTEVEISEEQKKRFAGYVAFMDIDTNAISEADITTDYEEATKLETLKKRLVHRLNYTVQEDGTYLAEFNEAESYRFDFSNSIFTYSNRTSRYIYNWKGDQGGFGDTCSIDFTKNQVTDGCDESVVKTMKDVRNYFLMELYYCGLSLDDLKQ